MRITKAQPRLRLGLVREKFTMTQWYYVQEGRQAGPVDDATFRQWVAEHRIGPEQLIWCEGMAQWQPAGTVPGLFSPTPPPIDYDPEKALAEIPTDGTGGRTGVGGILGQGWRSMVQNIPLLLGAAILLTLIGSVPNILQFTARPSPGEPEAVLFNLFLIVWTIFVTMPLTLGVTAFSLRVVCRRPANIGDVFSGYRLFGKAIGLQFWMGLLILLWSLLLIVPGIIAALRYSQAMYLITYQPKLGINQAVKASCEMMKGHKGRLFVLYILLLLIGLAFLIPIAIMIGITVGVSGGYSGAGAFSNPVFALLLQIGITVVSIPMAMFQWMVLANFHRDLTPPRVPASA